ncbi:MAG: ABC transporter ATP-binding protein/permease [Firmicutes bacterium]|nr:ABC transporter ATP-binding protein/permease [Bacillota bacterium]
MPARTVLKRLLFYIRPHLGWLFMSVLLTCLQVTAALYVPEYIGRAVDLFTAPPVSFAEVAQNIAALGGLTAAIFFCQWLASVFSQRVSLNTVRNVRIDAFKNLNRVPLAYIDAQSHGDIMSRIALDADQVSDGLIQGFTQLFTGVITAIMTVVFMLRMSVPIALVVMLITPLSLGAAWILARRTVKLHKRHSDKYGELCGTCEELLGNQKIVKAFCYEDFAEKRFDVINQDIKKVGTTAMFLSSLSHPVTRFLNSIVYAAVAVMGAFAVISANQAVAQGSVEIAAFTIGSLSAFLAYAHQFAKPFNEITGIAAELQASFASARRVFAVIDEPPEPSDKELAELQNVSGEVTAEHVAFAYLPDKPLIKDFNLSVQAGNKIAIVGPTGCGKTTLVNLLMRFYDVDSGVIKTDGTDIRTVTRSSLRSNYGMVLQDTWLFGGTIHDNIAYGKADATREEVIAAARQAKCNGFIKRLKDGYDTVISGDGANLSAGQKQLLCIARIMLTRPPMLILDEATSSIDTRTERRIQTAFARIMEGRTTFIIAHRLSTIVDADKILVMNEGDVIESGTHTELLAQGGFYKTLYESGFGE